MPSRWGFSLAKSLSIVVVLLANAFVPLSVAQPTEVTLTTLPPMMARPGEFITLVFTFDNASPVAETFDLQISIPAGFAMVNGTTSVNVGALNEAVVFFTVLVPTDAAVGDALVVLKATSSSNPAVILESTAVVQVVAVSQLTIVGLPEQQRNNAGTVVTFLVSNKGNVETSADFSASSESDFSVEVNPSQATLAPGAQVQVQVVVIVPPSAGASQSTDRVRFAAQSSADPERSAESEVLIELFPPPPQAIATGLGTRLPSSLSVALSRSSQASGYGAIATLSAAGDVLGFDIGALLAVDNSPSVRSSRFSISTEFIQVGFGDISGSFDSFARLAGRGARTTIGLRRAPLSNISLLGIRSGSLMAGLLNASLEFNPVKLSVSALLRRLSQTLEAQASTQMALNFDHSGYLLEAALSQAGDLWDTALRATGSFSMGPMSLNLELFRAGPDFKGGGSNQASLTLDHFLSFENLALQAQLQIGLNGLRPDPQKPSVGFSDLRLVANAFPGIGLPSLSGSFRQQTNKSIEAPLVVDTLTQSLSISAKQPFPFASLMATLGLDRTLDGLSSQDNGTISIAGLAGWSAQGASATLGVSNSIETDFGAKLVTGQTLEFSSTLGLSTPLGALSLRLVNVQPLTKVSASLSGASADATLSLSSEFQFVDAEFSTFSARLSFTRRFETPLPFAPVNGQIEGTVFVDANRNRRLDANEALANVLLIGGGARAVSDDNGFFRFPPLPPGNYLIAIESVISGFSPALELPLAVSLEAGQRLRVLIPLVPVSTIDGLIFNDENENGLRDEAEVGLANILVALDNEAGEETQRVVSVIGGRFSFIDLEPGTYTVRLVSASFPPRFEPTSDPSLRVTVGAQEQISVSFGLVEVPPEVRVTVSAPLANFTFDPEEPAVGQTVLLDASTSLDLDGEIVVYEWDFNSDGIVDAQGVNVSHTFTTAGQHPVTLTVTDDDGATAQTTKTLTVSE